MGDDGVGEVVLAMSVLGELANLTPASEGPAATVDVSAFFCSGVIDEELEIFVIEGDINFGLEDVVLDAKL